MIGLSVAIARFVEALFWAIVRVAGTVALAGASVLAVVILAVIAYRRWRGRRR